MNRDSGYTDDDDAGWWQRQDEDSRFIREQTERQHTMKYPAKGGGQDFELAPEGNHVAICNAIVDLGLQPGSGMYLDPKHQVYFRFELPGEVIEYKKDGESVKGPMSLGKTMTASMNAKATLRKFVESWQGKKLTDEQAEDFEFRDLLGKRCLLTITHSVSGSTGKTYANIGMATPLPKGMKSEEPQHNPSLIFDLAAPDRAVFEQLPKWLQEKVLNRITANKPAPSKPDKAPAEFNDDIPF